MDLIENGGFGASPIRTSVASFPAGGFFFLCHFCVRIKFVLFWASKTDVLEGSFNVLSKVGMGGPQPPNP